MNSGAGDTLDNVEANICINRQRKGDADPAGSKSLACVKRSDELTGEISNELPAWKHPSQARGTRA